MSKSRSSQLASSVDKVVWCERGWLPTHYGFCPSAKAWAREMKRLGIEDAPPYPESDDCAVTFNNEEKTAVIVTIHERVDSYNDSIGLTDIIAHESAHVWQSILEDIGERNPSAEFEAYALQNIVMNLAAAYRDTRGKKVRRKRSA